MIAYCGLDCEQCEAYIATQNNDDARRAKVAEEWARLYHAPIKPEHINCTGCYSAGVKTYYCEQMCEIRKCATTKSVGTCADCPVYPCTVLNVILQAAPQAKARLDALRKK
jgi:hypothetical protein